MKSPQTIKKIISAIEGKESDLTFYQLGIKLESEKSTLWLNSANQGRIFYFFSSFFPTPVGPSAFGKIFDDIDATVGNRYFNDNNNPVTKATFILPDYMTPKHFLDVMNDKDFLSSIRYVGSPNCLVYWPDVSEEAKQDGSKIERFSIRKYSKPQDCRSIGRIIEDILEVDEDCILAYAENSHLFYSKMNSKDVKLIIPCYQYDESKKDMSIAFYNGTGKRKYGAVEIKTSKAIADSVGSYFSEKGIQEICDQFTGIYVDQSEVLFAETPEQIETLYKKTDGTTASSCISDYMHQTMKYTGGILPVRAYGGDSDIIVAYTEDENGKPTARATLNKKTKKIIRYYPNQGNAGHTAAGVSLKRKLNGMGYEYDPNGSVGARLNFIRSDYMKSWVVCPYIDAAEACKNVAIFEDEEGKECIVVASDFEDIKKAGYDPSKLKTEPKFIEATEYQTGVFEVRKYSVAGGEAYAIDTVSGDYFEDDDDPDYDY